MAQKKRITGDVFYITTSVVDWIDIFSRPIYKHHVIDSLEYCIQQKGLCIYAWVLMTNHLHMIAEAQREASIADIMRDFKRYTSRKIINTLLENIQESRQDWMLQRFEYAGKNDKKIEKYKFWQDGYNIKPILTGDFLEQKFNYIHQNPVKAEFVNSPEEYRYSSAIDYAGGKGLITVTKL